MSKDLSYSKEFGRCPKLYHAGTTKQGDGTARFFAIFFNTDTVVNNITDMYNASASGLDGAAFPAGSWYFGHIKWVTLTSGSMTLYVNPNKEVDINVDQVS